MSGDAASANIPLIGLSRLTLNRSEPTIRENTAEDKAKAYFAPIPTTSTDLVLGGLNPPGRSYVATRGKGVAVVER